MEPLLPSRMLYVDDDSDDSFFLRQSIADQGLAAELVLASDGQEAVQMLDGMTDEALPCLIILDLNMPRWDGKQTLSYLKKSARYQHIPVVILSTSENRIDREFCMALGAQAYYRKPFHYAGYREILREFVSFVQS